MARLPRRSSLDVPASSRIASHRADEERVEVRATPRVAPRGGYDDRHTGEHPIGDEPAVDLDTAIEGLLAAGGVDPITRVRLSEARRAIAKGARIGDPAGFDGTSLSRALYRFVMPRLRNPEVLRVRRHHALLEELAEGLTRAAEDGVVREGALVIHRELRRLAQLRAARNTLVEG